MMVFDSIDDGFKMFQSGRDVFQKELVLDGKAVQEQAIDGEGPQHPVLGGVVFERFGVADEVLVSVVAFDMYAEHVFNGLSEAVEGGARQGLAIVQVVRDPKLSDLLECDAFCPLDGGHQPCVLPESVCVSHDKDGFLGKITKKTGVFRVLKQSVCIFGADKYNKV